MKDKMINLYDEKRELVEKEKALMESQINNMILQKFHRKKDLQSWLFQTYVVVVILLVLTFVLHHVLKAEFEIIPELYLVSKRCYKEPMSYEKAYGVMLENMGSQFDPMMEQVLTLSRQELEEYYSRM